MALIVCPHCGKSISDTLTECIHCGKSLRPQEETQAQVKRYEQLSSAEQNELFAQFKREYPEYVFPHGREKAAKKRKISSIAWTIAGVLCVIIFVIQILVATGKIHFETEGDDFLIPGIFLFIAVVTIICSVVIWAICRRSEKKYMQRYLLFAKLYRTWLSAREIKYKLTFGDNEKKYKKYYDNINPVLYLKEV